MTSCSEEMGWEFGRFWKRFSRGLTMVLRSWCPTMVMRSWGWTMGLRSWRLTLDHAGRQLSSLPLSWVFYCCSGSYVFLVPTSEDELRSKTPRDVSNVANVVSIVWLWKTFKNCVSLLMLKSWSQKLIKRSNLNNRFHLFSPIPAFVFFIVCFHIYTCSI